MNVKDDVSNTPAVPRSRRAPAFAAPALGAVLAIGLAFAIAPRRLPLFEARVPVERATLPAPTTPGVTAAVELHGAAHEIVLRGGSSAAVRAEAGAVAARESVRRPALERALATLDARWSAPAAVSGDSAAAAEALAPEPAPVVTCAALLRADAGARRELASALPEPYSKSAPPVAASAPVELRADADAVRRAAEARDAGALRAALDRLAGGEATWIAGGVPARDAAAAQRGGAWRRLQIERATAHEVLAGSLEMDLDSLALADVAARADAQRGDRGRVAGASLLALADGGPASVAVESRPVVRVWSLWLAAASLAGALGLTLFAALLGGLRRPRARAEFVAERSPAEVGLWLHVVTGPNPRAIARGVLEVAAHALARRERVLVVDGGPRLALHEVFEREPRWGLMECMNAEMPVLGLVQYGGRPGLYLLAHGNASRGEGWSRLGQCLDDIRPHFGRVVLALDAQAPRAVGEAIAGRPFEAWWSEPVRRLPRAAVDWVSRLGIALCGMDLSHMPEPTLEVLRMRSGQLEPAPLEPAWARVVEASTPILTSEALPGPEEVVLDSDLQVRERLRFLAWMRRVQKESRRDAEAPVLVES